MLPVLFFPSTYHHVRKLPTSHGVGCIKDDQQSLRTCYVDNVQVKISLLIMMLDLELLRGRIEPLDMTKKMVTEGRKLSVGEGLQSKEREELVKCLYGNLDDFV